MQIFSALISREKKSRQKRRAETPAAESAIDRRVLPAYAIAEAAHYLRLPPATLRAWVRPQHYRTEPDRKHFKSLIVLPKSGLESLSFVNLLEAHVIHAIQGEDFLPRIPLPRVYSALEHLRKEFESKHFLTEKKFGKDGIDVFIRRLQGLIPLAPSRQKAIRGLIRKYLSRIEYDCAGVAIRFYPFIRTDDLDEPRKVVIDPNVAFGRPILRGTGIAITVVAERYRAGDSIEILMTDYGCQRSQIEELVQSELALAA